MAKKLFRAVLLLMVFSLLSGIIVSCTAFSPIVGKWQDNSGNTYEFTRTGNVIINANNYVITGTWSTVSSNVITLNMQGDAGSMFNMLAGNSWQYTISGDTMTVEAGGSTNYLYRYRNPTTQKVVTRTTTIKTTQIAIPNTHPTIGVTYPRGGETFNAGQTITITWETTNLSKSTLVIVAYQYPNKAGTYITGVDGTPNTGSLKWTIPSDIQLNGGKAQIIVESLSGQSLIAEGDSGFFNVTN